MDNQQNISPAINEFLDKIIDEKKYENLLPEVRDQIKTDLQDRVNQYLNARLINKLDDKQVEELQELLKQKSEVEEVNKFFEDRIPNLKEVIAASLLDFRKIYLGLK
ncbi:hypothetical protein GYA19_00235 [Candidatus Beckwithbacteria bacterium]|nr:hypothetical protein [Candidatus Beckwithbacteria bacterium]